MASEDERIVLHVIQKREDYYAVLNIPKTATEDEIKRAYKKMALKLHPDKNKHPKAEEAFKHVSAAHTTLSDSQKRKIYDRHGSEGVQRHESGGGGGGGGGFGGAQYRQYHFGGGGFGGGDDLFEEIFSMFLDPRQRRYQQQQQYARQQQRAQQQQYYQQQQRAQQQRARGGQQHGGMEFEMGGNPLLAFAPLILFFIFAILLQSSSVFDTSGSSSRGGVSSSSSSGGWGADRRTAQEKNFRRSLFSLSKTPEHPHERVTTQLPDDLSDLQVPYFVNGQFEYTLSRYGQRLRNVELEVARSKKESLERRCSHDVKRGNHHTRSQACRDMEKFRKVPN